MTPEQNAVAQLYVRDAIDLIKPCTRPSWLTWQFDNIIRNSATQRHVLQMPSFANTEGIGVFSDYGGSNAESLFETYSFLFADFGAMEHFEEQIAALRRKHGIAPSREIAFKRLASGDMRSALPGFFRIVDTLPGLLFTLAVSRKVPSVIGTETNITATLQSQLASAGFRSWSDRRQAERLGRILHTVAYWLSLLGRAGMKTLWMTDNDQILGRSTAPKDFEEAYLRTLSLFDPPEFSILGWAHSFEVQDRQPYLHDLISVADLVAGAVAAFLSERVGAPFHGKQKEWAVAETLTLLGHQSVFLKKLTVVIDPSATGTYECGTMRLSDTKCSREGYTAVHFLR